MDWIAAFVVLLKLVLCSSPSVSVEPVKTGSSEVAPDMSNQVPL